MPTVQTKRGATHEAASKGKKQKKSNDNDTTTEIPVLSSRLDPKIRGIRSDALVAGWAPSSASTCVDCGQKIQKGTARWGITYAGNPLPQNVIPLYGSHPMVLWCHAGGCGLALCRWNDAWCAAARTCHYCQDSPDDTNQQSSLRLLCGGDSKGNKVRQHAFHAQCWRRAMKTSANDDPELLDALLNVSTKAIAQHRRSTIVWDELTPKEQNDIVVSVAVRGDS